MNQRVIIAFGANIGQREQQIELAIKTLVERGLTLCECSHYFETVPVGFVSNNKFINAVAVFQSSLSPTELLHITQEVERSLGRSRKSTDGIYHDRSIDIDILAIDDIVVNTPELTLPHPHLHERRFVLEPLCEVFPEFEHPTLHLTAKELLHNLNTLRIKEVHNTDSSLTASLNGLLQQLSPHFKELTIDDIQRIVSNEQSHLFVGCDELDKVVATCCLCMASSPTGKKAWLEDLVVDATTRGRGYAKQLLKHAVSSAKMLGASSLNLTSRPERVAANKLYQNADFKQRNTNVYRMDL